MKTRAFSIIFFVCLPSLALAMDNAREKTQNGTSSDKTPLKAMQETPKRTLQESPQELSKRAKTESSESLLDEMLKSSDMRAVVDPLVKDNARLPELETLIFLTIKKLQRDKASIPGVSAAVKQKEHKMEALDKERADLEMQVAALRGTYVALRADLATQLARLSQLSQKTELIQTKENKS